MPHGKHRAVRRRHEVRVEAARHGREVVIGDRQRRGGIGSETRAAGTGRITQRQVHQRRGIRHRVVEDGHREGLVRHAGQERQRPAHAVEVQAVDRIRGRRRVIHGARHIGHATAQHRDRRDADALGHRERVRAELEIRVVIHNRHQRVADAERRGTDRQARDVGQEQRERAVGVDVDVVDNRHREIRDHLARREHEHVGDPRIIRRTERGDIHRLEGHGRRVHQRAEARHHHQHAAG